MTINNRIVLSALLLLVVFWPLYLVFPEVIVPYVLDILNAMGVTIGLPVLWRYIPGAFIAIKQAIMTRKPLTKGPLLTIGITLTWMAMIIRTTHLWEWRYYREPESGLDTSVMAFAALLILPGGVCHLIASTMVADNYQVPKFGKSLMVGSGLCGVALGTIVALLRWYS